MAIPLVWISATLPLGRRLIWAVPPPLSGTLWVVRAGCCVPRRVAGCCVPRRVAGCCVPRRVAGCCVPGRVAGCMPGRVAGCVPGPVPVRRACGCRCCCGVGRLGAGAGLGAGAALTCGAGLGGGGALVFFWSPPASGEKIIRTKSTVDFFRILLFGMFKILTISYSCESFLCDFTVENGEKLGIP